MLSSFDVIAELTRGRHGAVGELRIERSDDGVVMIYTSGILSDALRDRKVGASFVSFSDTLADYDWAVCLAPDDELSVIFSVS